MSKEKTMIINSEVCDTRKMQENTYEEYDEIILNSTIVIVNERSKALFEKLNMICNADEFIDLDGDEEFSMPVVSVNGSHRIGGAVPAEDNIILSVNGSLAIERGAEEALKHYYKISVNGSVLCPESVAAYLSRITINGSTTIYPDDHTLLPKDFVIDKYFPIRAANNGKYFVQGGVKLLDKSVNIGSLVEKNVHFKTKRLLVPEEKLEEAAPLFDESTEFFVVPCGFAVVDGNTKLNDELIEKYGYKIFVCGNLDAKKAIADIASKIDELIVTGKVTLTKKSAEEFKKINAEYKKAEIVKEIIWCNQGAAELNNDVVNLSEDGISIVNCGTVTVAEDVTAETIIRLVDMRNIGEIICSQEQTAAVESVSTNVGRIITEPIEDTSSPTGEIIVNAEKYVM